MDGARGRSAAAGRDASRAGHRLARVVCALAGVVVLLTAPATGADASVVTGVSDQRPAFFDSPAYRALALNTVRLIVPWDAGLRAGSWDAWIARAQSDGAAVMVALEHDAAGRCPASPCVLPSTQAYGDALAALLARYPAITEVTAWNEPNHNSQPTFREPEAAAGYYEEARARCPACTIVAGDFLDDGGLPDYLAAYESALTSTPSVWGLHNYYDSTYFRSRGVSAMLAQTGGSLWLTETGGIVSFRPPGGGGLPYDEQRAADGVTWLYDLADLHPQIERMYLYQWQGDPGNGFDSGLLGYDGAPRPSYAVVAAHAGPRAGTPPAAGAPAQAGPQRRADVLAAPGANGTLRPGRRLRLLAGGRLELRLRCIARRPAARRCHQRLVVRVAGAVVARLGIDVAVRRSYVKLIRLMPRARRRLVHARAPRVQLQSCRWSGMPCTHRTDVRVSRPTPAASR